MSRYANDPRVVGHGPTYTVVCDGKRYTIIYTDVFGWTITEGSRMEYAVLTRPDGTADLAIGLPDADTAISLLIGEPA